MSTLPLSALEGPRAIVEAERAADTGAGFSQALEGALQSLEQAQTEADVQATQAAAGAGNLHELSLSLEKADIAMRVAAKLRNKVVDAYHEVMRMSV